MAVYCVPEKFVKSTMQEAAKKQVKSHVIITSGFSEVGNIEAEKELLSIAQNSGGRVVGPNIVGVLLNGVNANASFAQFLPYRGHSALVSQSGALLIGLNGLTYLRYFGCSAMIRCVFMIFYYFVFFYCCL
jgi:acyl-CoA synthetase (NDP forming)